MFSKREVKRTQVEWHQKECIVTQHTAEGRNETLKWSATTTSLFCYPL